MCQWAGQAGQARRTAEAFPAESFTDVGYRAVASGQKTYNGVAVISKAEPTDHVTDFPGFEDPQRRILASTIDDVRVINLYVPNGSEVGSEKYDYKLGWLKALKSFLEGEIKQYEQVVVLGDFNIAPDDRDVHDPEKWGAGILCSPLEREALNALIDLGLGRTRSQSDGSISVRTRANILSPNVSKSHGVAIVLEELLRK